MLDPEQEFLIFIFIGERCSYPGPISTKSSSCLPLWRVSSLAYVGAEPAASVSGACALTACAHQPPQVQGTLLTNAGCCHSSKDALSSPCLNVSSLGALQRSPKFSSRTPNSTM